MPAPSRPHISAALQHMRRGVTLAGVALCLALIAQVVVWGCVHFMDLRTQVVTPGSGTAALTVVVRDGAGTQTRAAPANPAPPANKVGRSLVDGGGGAPTNSSASAPAPPEVAPETVNPNIVKSQGDLVLSRFAAIVQTIGVFAAVALFVLMLQGVVIAGGASVPGVELAVTAGLWSLVITALCVPLTGLIPGSGFPGVFASYQTICVHADAYRLDAPTALGAPGYYGLFLLLPVLVGLGTAACVVRFRAGVEEGVIVTSVTQFDERIEKEIRSNKWGALSTPRAMGALNRAMGDRSATAPAETPEPASKDGPAGALRRPI